MKLDQILHLMNLKPGPETSAEDFFTALHSLKARGIIDFKISLNEEIEIQLLAPDLIFQQPTFH
jgi:hypothetical protein